jgi:hypothetical protein
MIDLFDEHILLLSPTMYVAEVARVRDKVCSSNKFVLVLDSRRCLDYT